MAFDDGRRETGSSAMRLLFATLVAAVVVGGFLLDHAPREAVRTDEPGTSYLHAPATDPSVPSADRVSFPSAAVAQDDAAPTF